MRNLTKTLAVAALLAPASVYSLGIGDIKLHSALNQKLDAEIALLVSAGEDVSNLKVKLAPPDKFDEAGVPWNYFLSKIKFKAVTLANGSTVVKLSSNEALREPFLDFLLEVSWDKGNLYREFTVLVDPPVAYTKPVIPVIQKPAQAKVAVAKVENKRNSTVKPVFRPRQKNQARRGEYGPTKRRDSLWRVSELTNSYGDVSREQMMMAIFEANPVAFHKGNVNFLKAGYMLDIPKKSVIISLSKKDATQRFSKQIAKWGGRVTNGQKKPQQRMAFKANANNTRLELEAPSEAEIAEMALIVSRSNQDTRGTNAGIERSSLPSAEALVLQARMDKLEDKLDTMQGILVLKDESFATIQNTQKLANKIKEGTIQASDEVISKVVKPIVPEPAVTEDINEVNIKKKSATSGQIVVEEDVNLVNVDNNPLPTPAVETKVEQTTAVVLPDPLVQPKPEKSLFSAQTLAAIGIPVLGLLGWLMWRREKSEEELDDGTMFASASEIGLPDDDFSDLVLDDDSTSFDVDSESSLLSEFGTSDFNSFDTEENEVDPILESDVYLAYGRYQQAEDLMRQAVVDQPERDECKLKLLEIFHANENKDAFEKYVTELMDSGKQNDDSFWGKVEEMSEGLNLDPSLFSTVTKSGDKANFQIDESEGEGGSENELLLDENDNSDEQTGDSSADVIVEEDNNMEFDLSIFDEDDSKDDAGVDEENIELAIDDGNGLDFDLKTFDLEKPEAENKLTDSEIEEQDSFDFSLDGLTETTDEDTQQATESFENFSFDQEEPLTTPSIDEGISDLTYMDEMEAKIDLAKAYIEMEDFDSAKVIAAEVLSKGNEEQKASAREILEQNK